MRKLLFFSALVLLVGCQSTPSWLAAPHEIQNDTFYFGEVTEAEDGGWLWQDCVTGNTRPIAGKRTFSEVPHGPVSMLAQAGAQPGSPLQVLAVLGSESDGSCAEHANASVTNTLWQLVAWPQQRQLNNANLQLLITDEGSARGSLDCHAFDADITTTGKGFTLHAPDWSASQCDSKGLNPSALPEQFFGYWQANTYGNTLMLSNLQGQKLFFRALYL